MDLTNYTCPICGRTTKNPRYCTGVKNHKHKSTKAIEMGPKDPLLRFRV